jgi:Zn-dependent peptidase ImmA (M78 family)
MPPPLAFRSASAFAKTLTRLMGSDEFPVNINLIFKLRKDIEPPILESMPDNDNGYVRETTDGTWQIFINSKLSYAQQRMTLFHEVFHILNHENLCESRKRSLHPDHVLPINEDAADQFAEEMNLPEAALRREWEKSGGDMEYIAKISHSPSVAVVERRIRALGL